MRNRDAPPLDPIVQTPAPVNHQTIIVLDFGSQFTQLIARRLRELSVYSEILPFDTPMPRSRARNPVGIILSGGPQERLGRRRAALRCRRCSTPGVPVLGICYGMQLMTARARRRGRAGAAARVRPRDDPASQPSAPLLRRRSRPSCECGRATATSSTTRAGRISRSRRRARTRRSRRWRTQDRGFYALLFHPEVAHTERGARDPPQLRLRRLRLHRRLDDGVVRARRRPTRIRAQVGDGRVVCGAERRRRLDRRGAAHSPRDRRPADLHLRRQRRAAARRGGADSQALRAAAAAAGVRRRVGAVPRSARRRHRSGAEAQDHRRDVHRRVRGRSARSSDRSTSWRRARCIRT